MTHNTAIATTADTGLAAPAAEQPLAAAQPLAVEDLQARTELVRQIMRSVMREGTHFGTVPGVGKPMLFKAGSEALAATFRIALELEVEDLRSATEARFRIYARGLHQVTGALLGTGIGEASSLEEKYRWRAVICPEEYDETAENKRRLKFKRKYGGGVIRVQQVATEPADLRNTVIKMAAKRSRADCVLAITGASSIFAPDDGSGAPGARERRHNEPRRYEHRDTDHGATPSAGTAAGPLTGPMTASMLRTVQSRIDATHGDLDGLLMAFGVDRLEDLPAAKVNAVLEWINEQV